MTRKGPAVFVIALLILVSLSCTNPIQIYLSTQTAIMQTATATMWTPTPTYTLTHTPTKTPTSTPIATPTPEHLYFDDFEDEDTGWLVSDTASSLREYTDGGYRIKMKDAEYFGWSRVPDEEYYSDVRIEVDATKIGGLDDNHFGVICRFQDKDNFYGLEISSSGYALIYKYEDGTLTGLSADRMEAVDGINADDLNQIVAVCNRENLELYVNGDLVASATDSSFSDGEVALVVGNLGDILFDNLYIRSAE